MTVGYYMTMGILERKTREKEERKKLILERAKELILERGIPALSMQDIADAAELSKATLYLYFQSKEAILTEILTDSADAFVSYVEDRLNPHDSGLEAMRKLWGSYLRFFGESPDIFVLTGIRRFVEPNPDDTVVSARPTERKLLKLIAKVLERGVADGTLDAALSPEKIARIAMMIAMAIIDEVARMPREKRDVHLIQEEMQGTFELLLRGVAATGTDRALLTLPNEKD
jgi:AcrR family transcriptional regulator